MTEQPNYFAQYGLTSAQYCTFDTGAEEVTAARPEPQKIGGWLIVVAIALGFQVFKLASLFHTVLLPVFTSGDYSILTDVNSPSYHPLWKPVLLFEVVTNVGLLAMTGVAIVLMIRKSHLFPKLMIAMYAVNFLVVVVDCLVSSQIPAVAEQSDPASRAEMIKAMVPCVVWIPYMCISQRVKDTFVC